MQRELKVDYIARVEGEGRLNVVLSDGQIRRLEVSVFEPPRFFEGWLRGRKYDEVVDFVARICGICPISYQMAACTAIENAFEFTPSGQTRMLRRVFSWAEIMQSHVLHIYFLAAPDFFGMESAIAMAEKYPDVVSRGLRLKRAVNDLSKAIGGREVHPVVPKVTGFHDVPSRQEIEELIVKLTEAKTDAAQTLEMALTLPLPDWSRDCDYLCLSDPGQYALNEGNVVTASGASVPMNEFTQLVDERQVPYSNALQSHLKSTGKPYMTGPLARVNINHEQLSDDTKTMLRRAGVSFPTNNPYLSIVARSAEVLSGIDDCLSILEALDPHPEDLPIEPRASEGFGITEAPRGTLFHHYEFDEAGLVTKARLITPTAQNQARMEADLRELLPTMLDRSDDELTFQSEIMIRNYDPCISCATHFLTLNIEHR